MIVIFLENGLHVQQVGINRVLEELFYGPGTFLFEWEFTLLQQPCAFRHQIRIDLPADPPRFVVDLGEVEVTRAEFKQSSSPGNW